MRGGPGFDSLSQEEKDKLKAASEKAMQDAKVKDAREKMEAAGKEFREAMLISPDQSTADQRGQDDVRVSDDDARQRNR